MYDITNFLTLHTLFLCQAQGVNQQVPPPDPKWYHQTQVTSFYAAFLAKTPSVKWVAAPAAVLLVGIVIVTGICAFQFHLHSASKQVIMLENNMALLTADLGALMKYQLELKEILPQLLERPKSVEQAEAGTPTSAVVNSGLPWTMFGSWWQSLFMVFEPLLLGACGSFLASETGVLYRIMWVWKPLPVHFRGWYLYSCGFVASFAKEYLGPCVFVSVFLSAVATHSFLSALGMYSHEYWAWIVVIYMVVGSRIDLAKCRNINIRAACCGRALVKYATFSGILAEMLLALALRYHVRS